MTEFKEKEVQKMLDQLNSEITEERRNAVRKIIKLEEETNKVKKALGIQTAKNEKLEKPHKKVSEELRGHRFEEYSLSQGVEELQSNIREYQIKTSMLLNTIERKDNEIQAAKEKRNTIQRGLEKLLKEHKESLANMRNQLKEIEKSQEASELNIKAYEEKKETLTANEKRYETEKEKLQSIFKKKESGVMKIENEYMAKAEATAQLQEEIDEMVEKTKNLNLSSRCLIDNLKQQAETMKGHLANEQKERVQVQRTQRKLHRQIASFNDEQSLCVRKYHRRINEAKSKLLFLDKEKIRLDEESKKNQEKANEIQSKINTEIAQHDSERLKCAEKIASLSKMLDDSNGICKQLNKEIQDELPVLEDLNSKVKKNEQVESETKSLQVEMNQTIRSLESEIRQLNDANKTLDFDLKQLRKQIMTLESDYKKKLADQIDLLNSTESNIYTNVCRLNTVNIENARLDGGILKQEQSIQEICSDWEKILRIKSKLRNRYRSLTDIIENDHLSEQRLIQSSIEFYKYLIEEKMKFISTECCQRDQLFKQILPELWRLFNEINQFFEIGKSISQQIVSSKVDKMLALPSSQNVDVHQENNYTNNKKNDNNNNDGDNNDDVRKCQN
nr:unnamed protein product [Trichobilharzia regenti]